MRSGSSSTTSYPQEACRQRLMAFRIQELEQRFAREGVNPGTPQSSSTVRDAPAADL